MQKRRLRDYILAILLRIPLVAFFAHDWDIYVFTMTAKLFVLEGLLPYDPAMEDKLIAYIPYYPSQFNWYAYPPIPFMIFVLGYLLYLLFSQFGLKGIFFERFFVGFLISMGDIPLAFYSCKLGRELYDEKTALRIERAILFNPFIIFVSSFWGMIDGWSTAFLVASIYYIMRREYSKSALFYALSFLVKQLTLFFAPLILAYLAKRETTKTSLKYVLTSTLVSLVICGPFLALYPKNFAYQVFLFHIGRYPQGVSIPATIFIMLVSLLGPTPSDRLLVDSLSNIVTFASFTVMIMLLIYIALRYMASDLMDNRYFMQALLVSFLIVLFLNKVSNLQYFVTAVVLGIIGSPGIDVCLRDRMKAFSNTALILSILMTFGAINFFSHAFYLRIGIFRILWVAFIRKDVALVSPVAVIISILIVITTVRLYYIFIEIFIEYFPRLRLAFPWAIRRPVLASQKVGMLLRRIAYSIGSKHMAVFCMAIITVGALASLVMRNNANNSGWTHNQSTLMTSRKKEHMVGIFYKWYIKEAYHEYDVPSGPWRNAKLTPIDGYYESSLKKLAKDLSLMKDIGIDFIIIDVLSVRVGLADQIIEVTSENNMSFCILVNITSVLYDLGVVSHTYTDRRSNKSDIYFELHPGNLNLLKNYVMEIYSRYLEHPKIIHVNTSPLVLFEGIQRFLPGWEYGSQDLLISYLVQMIEERENITDDNEVLAWFSENLNWSVESLDDLRDYYPRNITDFLTNESNTIWREVFRYAWRKEIMELLPQNATIAVLMEHLPDGLIEDSDLMETADLIHNVQRLYVPETPGKIPEWN